MWFFCSKASRVAVPDRNSDFISMSERGTYGLDPRVPLTTLCMIRWYQIVVLLLPGIPRSCTWPEFRFVLDVRKRVDAALHLPWVDVNSFSGSDLSQTLPPPIPITGRNCRLAFPYNCVAVREQGGASGANLDPTWELSSRRWCHGR